MSDSKLKSLKDLLWGTGIFVCMIALVIAFFFCAVTRNEYARDDRSFAFTNSVPSSGSKTSQDGLDAYTADAGSDAGADDSDGTEGNGADGENDAQYFNAAEYWSAIANGSDGGSESTDSGSAAASEGLDA